MLMLPSVFPLFKCRSKKIKEKNRGLGGSKHQLTLTGGRLEEKSNSGSGEAAVTLTSSKGITEEIP